MGQQLPDWVQATIAVAMFVCGGFGLYLGISNKVVTTETKMDAGFTRVEEKLTTVDTYQTYLQQQADESEHRITVLEVKVAEMEKGQTTLATSVTDLAKEIKVMNKNLIILTTKSENNDG